jgi:hypothetical protein
MFLRFRVNAAIAKFITANRLHAETLKFFESGPIDAFMPAVEVAGFDANQGAVAVITGTITEGAKNGALTKLKAHAPLVYRDLVVLWKYCGELCAADEKRFGNAGYVGSIDSNPFDHADRDSHIQNAIDKFGDDQLKEGKLVKDTANQIKLVSEIFDMHLCLSAKLRGREVPDPGDGYLMVVLGTAVGMGQIIGRDSSFAETCLQKYLCQYRDADAVIARMAQRITTTGFADIFYSSIEAYRDFHNSGEPTAPYLRLADVYLDSGLS